MAAHQLRIELAGINRAQIRREVVGHWLAESPGTPDERETYEYTVEALQDGSRIYVKRPGWKNKGMDFVVWCEGFPVPGRASRPSFDDVYAELAALVAAHPAGQAELLRGVRQIWDCESPVAVLRDMPQLGKDVRVERLLKILRWLFIEQDLTYWTESGRWMLRGGMEDVYGALS